MWTRSRGSADDDAPLGHQRRLEKHRIDVIEPRVSVGAIDGRVVVRVQRDRMAAHGHSKLRRIGFAVHAELSQCAAEFAMG